MTQMPTASTASDLEDADCCSKFLEGATSPSSSPEMARKKGQKLTWSFQKAEGNGVNGGEDTGLEVGARNGGCGGWT